MLSPIAGKAMAPNDAWECDDKPIQRAEKQALNRMSVLMRAKAEVILCRAGAEKNENSQRQAPAIPGQIGDNAVAEPLTAGISAAAEKHQQTGEVDRQTPGKLKQIEKRPGPAGRGCFFHDRDLFHP